MFQSLERNKGVSLISKKKDKNTGNAIQDLHTFERLNSLSNDGSMNLSFDIVESLRKKTFANRKELKTYLRDRNFSWRQIDTIIWKLYAK